VLDAATLDRFDIIDLPTDKSLETEIIGASVADQVKDIRETLKKWNYEKSITMRDSIRLKKRIELNLVTGFIEKLFENNDELIADFNERRERKTFIPQEMCNTIDELILNVKKSQGVHDA